MKGVRVKYQKIWDKVLSQGETVKHEFSISDQYRVMTGIFAVILWLIIGSVFHWSLLGFSGLVLLLLIFYYFRYLELANAYAFTDRRVVIHRGWLSTKTTSIYFDKIADVTVEEPFFDRLFSKSGNIAIQTADSNQHDKLLRNVSNPYELKKTLDHLRQSE